MSQIKQDLINKALQKPIEAGDTCSYIDSNGRDVNITIKRVDKYFAYYRANCRDGQEERIDLSLLTQCILNVGINPMAKRNEISSVQFSIGSILSKLGLNNRRLFKDSSDSVNGIDVKLCNFNPFIILDDGSKYYYQRESVWTLKNKQELISSLYNRIDCGMILILNNSYAYITEILNKGYCDISWCDILDGKQRLIAISEFVNNQFSDLSGYYWDDLSELAQREFLNQQTIRYAEINSRLTNEEILKQFLVLNYAGVPQSIEHINKIQKQYDELIKL